MLQAGAEPATTTPSTLQPENQSSAHRKKQTGSPPLILSSTAPAALSRRQTIISTL